MKVNVNVGVKVEVEVKELEEELEVTLKQHWPRALLRILILTNEIPQ